MKRALFKIVYIFSLIVILGGYFPVQAIGDSPIDENVVEGLRSYVARTHQDEGVRYQPAPELIPLARSLLGYIDSLPEGSPKKQRLTKNVLSMIEQEEVSECWLVGKFFEIAQEKGAPSGEEAELFIYAFQLKDRDPHLASSIGFYLSMEALMARVNFIRGDTHILRYANEGMRGNVEKKLKQHLPVSVTYPIPGIAKFEIPFLIKMYLQHVFPSAFSDAPVPAHGIRMSPGWFALHDAFHRHDDTRFLAIVNHVMRRMDQYVKKGASAEEFLEAYIPYAVRSYNRMMNAFQELFKQMERIESEEERRRAYAGFVLMLHEYSPYPIYEPRDKDFSDAFTQEDFGILMILFTESVKRDLEYPTAWESPEDLLITLPLTGESLMTDAQIMKQAEERLQYHKILGATDEGQRQEIMKDIASQTIERGRRFIAVRTTWKDGFEEPMAIYPTLAHKWANMDDSLALLEYAGVSIKKPDLTLLGSPEEQYKVAQEVLGQVQVELQRLMDSFKSTSERIIQETGLGEGFARDFREQAEKMKTHLERLLPQQQDSVAIE